ncbi:S-adenosyl-L-methionine-dependent methyltransferase [Xylariaceae sp. FL1272]|nr:S-adenosyl-L-methionine-dependent methyltransferase [Xylariaceae sp. FL1272]
MGTKIMELATRIAENTARVNEYLLSQNLPTPSFNVDGPLDTMIPKDEVEVESARVAIIDDTLKLRRLILGPRDYLMSYTHDELISQQAIARYRIAHSFPVGQQASFADIAATTGLSPNLVRRFIRHAIVKDIFTEPEPNMVAHNAVSRLLAEDQLVHDWVGASTEELWPAAAQTCNALDKWRTSEEPHETGFALANNEQSIYSAFLRFPERARRFGSAMQAFTQGTGFELTHVINAFAWSDLGAGTVVDVGGSQGFASFAIAREFPALSCIVQDLEPVVSAAVIPPELSNSVKFMTHDFFTEQPVVGADVYFFRLVIHNWSDKHAIQLLRNHIPALKTGAKIIINDSILPKPGVLSQWQEDRLRSMDLTMTETQNSYEREVEDWVELLVQADPRLKFLDAKQPPGSNLGFVIAEWDGEQ